MKPKIKVVVIDDVRDILDLIQYNLEKEGMIIDVFNNGNEAIKHITNDNPDVVISDWMMPHPDGIEVCKQLKNHLSTRDIPIIMLTCKGGIQDYQEAMEAGANDYIAKPVKMKELIRRIKLLVPNVGYTNAYVG